jgi:hypothetical protein
MTTSITRSTHTLSLLDGEVVEESDLGSMRRVTHLLRIRDRLGLNSR